MKCLNPEIHNTPKKGVHKKKKLDPKSSSGPLQDKSGAKTQQPVPNNHRAANPHHEKRRLQSLQPLVEEDDRDLAADRTFLLPRDGPVPRLVRQESFQCEDNHNHDLYALGLLYDDERLRGPGFHLDAIVHSEPLYSVRPAKRRRRGGGGGGGGHNHREAQFDAAHPDPDHLPLDLSFSSLGDDLVLARLLAPGADELVADAEEDDDVPQVPPPLARRRRARAPLTVIYELEESWALSLSSNLTSPVAIEPPDLVSDDDEGEGEEEEEQFTLLGDEISLGSDEEAEVEDVLSVTGEPWIVLGHGLS